MSRASRHPRHRRPGSVALGPGAARVRAGAAAGLVVGLALALGGAGEPAAGTGDAGASGAAGTARAEADPHAAEVARWTARAEAAAQAATAEADAVAGAALAAAAGVDALRVAPDPVPALADLDAAVRELRASRSVLAGGPVLVARDVPTTAGTATAPARLDAAAAVEDAAAEVFRLTLQVERDAPLPAAGPLDSHAAAFEALADLEQAVADVRAQAQELRAAGPAAAGGPGLVARSGRVVSGPLRADGTADPAGLCPVPFAAGALLRCDAVDALVALNDRFRADHGVDLPVGGTYRTHDEQVRLKAAKGGLAAAPGTSHHGWGVAVDFSGFGGVGQFDRPLYRWMVAHGPAYGWIHPEAMGPGGAGPHEPWHWEYAGPATTPAATTP